MPKAGVGNYMGQRATQGALVSCYSLGQHPPLIPHNN